MTASGSADQFRIIAEVNGDVAWIVDCATGLPRYISPSIEPLLGYGPGDFQSQMGEAAAAIQSTPLARLCGGLPARLARFAAGDLSRVRVVRQFEQPHRDGRLVPIEVVSSLVLDAAGWPDVLVGIVRDLTARREQADEQEAEQRRFASMLNHEFRTPLSSIDGAVQRLESTGVNADAPTRERYRRISVAVERLIGMLDDYLSPDRIEQIGGKRPAGSIDPRQLLIEAAALVRAAGRGVSLDVGDLPASLRCEPQGLRLALKVLVDNALQYGPADAPIALSGRRAGAGIELLVRDGGGGVPAADIAHIFAKSWRGSNAGARPGSGLGLYMARSVIEVHGGILGVRNTQPEGAEFRIWVPLRELTGKNVASGGNTSDNSSNNYRLASGAKNIRG
jgi:signal transduction histidine kinase